MKLTLKQKHLFFEPFEINLPDFTVITGLNGSGKTHLLKSIKNLIIVNDITNNINKIRFFATNTYNLSISEHFFDEYSPSSLYWDYLHRIKHGENIDGDYKALDIITNKISEVTQKSHDMLDENDFNNYEPLNFNNYPDSFEGDNFANMCLRYYKRLDNNNYRKYQSTILNINKSYLTDEEFISYHGQAPWTFINNVFTAANINYFIEHPDYDIERRNISFKLNLINKTNKSKITFQDLSSGEQTLVLISLSIYNIRQSYSRPAILLMDEPDASLHPSMIKNFLRVLQDVFVKEQEIKVIITTHNPSTVALAPVKSIYIMSGNDSVIKESTKDSALKLLTAGVPSLSINYENRRQVFVESPYDVEYYENLYDIFSSKLEPEVSLNFIASGDIQINKNGGPKHSCDIVMRITEIMSGNRHIYGIIDFDNKNTSSKNLIVLGNGNRYSTENYFLDPLLLAIFMLIENIITNKEVGIQTNENYLSFINFDSEKLNHVASCILHKIVTHVNSEKKEMKVCTLINQESINLPEWFLYHNGHELEIAIKKAFPKLNGYNKDGDKTLKIAIIKKVIAIFPGLASQDLLQVLRDIQL